MTLSNWLPRWLRRPRPAARTIKKADRAVFDFLSLEDRWMPSLSPIVTETGLISVSIDGMGTNAQTGTIQVNKPVGATVKAAYLMAASTGFSGYQIPNGQVLLSGAPVTFTNHVASSISSHNYFTDVTTIVKGAIDAAAPGTINLTISEGNASSNIDGEVLAVIFNDPNQTQTNTVVLMFGAQNIAGDTFAIGLADPVNLSNPNLAIDMSLGISFGYQQGGGSQYSQVDVNGQRLTTSAGGEDDGEAANGALITVGGIGDSNANPANPNATPNGTDGPRSDDELYNLLPFVQNGDTSINVFTKNPSTDDNIFFAALSVKGATAVVGEGILLSPSSETNPVGASTTVTATVQNTNGQPVPSKQVTFTITSGPNAGLTGNATTDANGKATFTYTGNGGAGVDEIVATFVNSQNQTVSSAPATRTWEANSLDTTPPTVTEVRAYYGDAAHPNLYVNLLDPANDRILPWLNIKKVAFVFSEDVDVDSGALALTGVNVANYALTWGGYDSGTRTATWTLASPIGIDRLTMTLDGDDVADLAGNKLAGDGNAAGTDFVKGAKVLPGDFDASGVVTLFDQVKIRNVIGTGNVFGDIDGDGDVDTNDVNAARLRNTNHLP